MIAAIATGCGQVEYHQHLFDGLTIQAPSGLSIQLNAYGSWRTLAGDSVNIEVNGTPYTVELTIEGADSVLSAELEIIDPEGGDRVSVGPENWDRTVTDGRRTILVVDASVDLPKHDILIEGTAILGAGLARDTVSISGVMTYRFRIQRQGRVTEAMQGV